MSRVLFFRCWILSLALLCAVLAGCGTTKWSDSPRTATEQLLISDAVDRAISEIDFSSLANKNVYLDTRFIITTLDQNYLTSTLRQHMLASGCIIKDKAEDSTYVVEVRTGSVGTNRQDLLSGMPSTTLPTVGLLPTGSATIPEIALIKRTNQQAVCKIAVFAYDRQSGRHIWQSGNQKIASRAKDIWVLGAGPFQRGAIYDGTAFAGDKLSLPLMGEDGVPLAKSSVGMQKVFLSGDPQNTADASTNIENARYLAPLTNAATPASPGDPNAPAITPTAAKAAYTPPVPPVVAPPPPPASLGPQGNLTSQPVLQPITIANPAAATADAIQSFTRSKKP